MKCLGINILEKLNDLFNIFSPYVFKGFEQELVSESENWNLVIRDFRLKDYPILIRLSQ